MEAAELSLQQSARSSERILERLERAVRGERTTV